MARLMNLCPGAAGIRGTPTLKEKNCPVCGRVIEIFSNDMEVPCECGFTAYNDAQTCITWCKYARECVGDEIYERYALKNQIQEQQTKGESING